MADEFLNTNLSFIPFSWRPWLTFAFHMLHLYLLPLPVYKANHSVVSPLSDLAGRDRRAKDVLGGRHAKTIHALHPGTYLAQPPEV